MPDHAVRIALGEADGDLEREPRRAGTASRRGRSSRRGDSSTAARKLPPAPKESIRARRALPAASARHGRHELRAAGRRHLADRVLDGELPRPARVRRRPPSARPRRGPSRRRRRARAATGRPTPARPARRPSAPRIARSIAAGVRREAIGLRRHAGGGDAGHPRERPRAARARVLLVLDEDDERALALHDPGLALLAAQRPDAVEAHRVGRVPLVDRPGEHRPRAARGQREGREEQRVQRPRDPSA